jgi:D-alanyl-D-alanine carboxypeptidase
MIRKQFFKNKTAKFRKTSISRMTAQVLAVTLVTVFLIGLPVFAELGQQDIELLPVDEIDCASYIVYNVTKQKIVIAKNENDHIYPASMTKILTAALALEYLDPDTVLTVSDAAINATTPNSSLMKLKIGEKTTVSELLYGLMLPSGNDAANVLGEAVVDATGYKDPANPDRSKMSLFNDVMNNKAKELGLTDTNFLNPSGLHDPNHYTTAAELEKLFEYALEQEEFRTVISAPTHVFKATNIPEHSFDSWSIVKNSNCLLTDPWIVGEDAKLAQIVGGKTGTTIDGGTGVALLSVSQNGDELISVVCGIPYDKADRQTYYVASVVSEGGKVCFEGDPVVRVAGNVIDNRPFNAPASMPPTGEKIGSEVVTEPTKEPTPEASQVTVTPVPTIAQTVTPVPEKEEGFSLVNFFRENMVLSIILLSLIVILLSLIIIYIVSNRSRDRRRGYGNIRRL